MAGGRPTNDQIADVLDRIADLLEIESGNRFRIRAYRDAAHIVRGADDSIARRTQQGGEDALKELPSIGEGIASVIASYVRTGRSDLLDQLQGEVEPGKLFTEVPGIGEQLARRIAEDLDVSTLEDLEQAAHDSRLQGVRGFGPKRVHNIRVSLASMLSTAARRLQRRAGGDLGPHRVCGQSTTRTVGWSDRSNTLRESSR
jgi:DNA polymerase/3'-5' exonuclease PolX